MRYYYDDPIKAAYMAREFQFRFTDKHKSCELFYDNNKDFPFNFTPSNAIGCGYTGKEFYLFHCHEMLKPQVEDVVKTLYSMDDIERVFKVIGRHSWEGEDGSKPEVILLDSIQFPSCGEKTIEIIQRNGKAFFMPEREE